MKPIPIRATSVEHAWQLEQFMTDGVAFPHEDGRNVRITGFDFDSGVEQVVAGGLFDGIEPGVYNVQKYPPAYVFYLEWA